SLPADLVGSVLVLKELFDMSDAQTAEALRFDIRWKVACGRSLTQTSFNPSTLVYWRRRIAASQRPDRVFAAGAEVIAGAGVLAELCGEGAPEREAKAGDALGLLALVAGQDVEPAEDSDGTDGRWRIARKVAADRVISTVDPQTRHTRKSKSVRRDGYRAHVAAEPDTGLITDCELTKAAGQAGSDPVAGEQMISRDRYHQADAEPVPDERADQRPGDNEPAHDQPSAADQENGEGL